MRFIDRDGNELVEPDISDKLIEYRSDGDEGVCVVTPCGPEREEALAQAEADKERREEALEAPDAIADLSETVSSNAVDVAGVSDALADLSETVSDNAGNYEDLSDVIAELSQLVSDLANKEA